MPIDHQPAVEVHSGHGAVEMLRTVVPHGAHVVVVAHRSVAPDVLGISDVAGRLDVIHASGEPTLESVGELIAQVEPSTELVIGCGGGSVLDAAKAVAGLHPNRDAPILEHLEVVGTGRRLDNDPLPVVALPTTAGTGSEMTRNAVISVPGRKVSLRDPRLLPRTVIIDPDLGRDVPHTATAHAALDAAVQLIESYATPLATPWSDLYAAGGAQRGLPVLDAVVLGEPTREERLAMALAAAWSGAALARAKLGTIHGFAGVLGGMTPLGHGELCGIFAAPVLAATIGHLRRDQPQHPSLGRYAQLARWAAPGAEAAEDLVEHLRRLTAKAPLRRDVIAALEPTERDAAVTATREASSTRGNPVSLDTAALHRILEAAAQ